MKRSPLRRVSKKQAVRLREYHKLRNSVLSNWTFCEMPDCGKKAQQIHHTRGRYGENLIKTSTWMLLCIGCHRKIHDEPRWAREQGYLL